MSQSDRNNMCQMCNTGQAKYTCPRCSLPYCSVDCYKSTSHLDCSEGFYKECVESEMKNAIDPEDKNKMMQILKRVHEQGINQFDPLDDNIEDYAEDDCSIDSDDDDDIPELSERIKNVDLNNVDELWAVLTDSERQEFEAILKNGEEEKILPLWTPWWSRVEEKKLVEEVGSSKEENETANNYLPVIVDIPVIKSVEKSSNLIGFILLNVLSSYVCMVLHHNGEHHNSPRNSVTMFLELADNLKNNKVFEDSESAIEAVVQKAIEHELLPKTSNEESAIITSVKQIINGPDKERPNFFVLTALSDLHGLFTSANQEASEKSLSSIATTTLPKKMQNKLDFNIKSINFSGKKYQLYFKKLEYYLAWSDKFPEGMKEIIK